MPNSSLMKSSTCGASAINSSDSCLGASADGSARPRAILAGARQPFERDVRCRPQQAVAPIQVGKIRQSEVQHGNAERVAGHERSANIAQNTGVSGARARGVIPLCVMVFQFGTLICHEARSGITVATRFCAARPGRVTTRRRQLLVWVLLSGARHSLMSSGLPRPGLSDRLCQHFFLPARRPELSARGLPGIALGGGHRVCNQHRDRHSANSAGHRRDAGCDLAR